MPMYANIFVSFPPHFSPVISIAPIPGSGDGTLIYSAGLFFADSSFSPISDGIFITRLLIYACN